MAKLQEEKRRWRRAGHCDCLALTFASHILLGCQWHSTDEFSVTPMISAQGHKYPLLYLTVYYTLDSVVCNNSKYIWVTQGPPFFVVRNHRYYVKLLPTVLCVKRTHLMMRTYTKYDVWNKFKIVVKYLAKIYKCNICVELIYKKRSIIL